MTPKLNPALAPEALYAKSQVYIKRGFRAKQQGDTEEYQLWASLALELLGKAVLARVHPALVADPTHYQSVFAACGRQLSPDVKTIAAKTVFQRLGHIAKDFDTKLQDFCEQMALRRNAELHSGESPFSGMKADAWEKKFWHAVQILLSVQDKTLEAWIGAEDSKAPKQILEDAKTAIGWAVSGRIERAKEEFSKAFPDPAKRAQAVLASKSLKRWEHYGAFDISVDGYDLAECPSCESQGVLGGILWSEEVTDEHDPDDPTIEFVEKEYLSEEFLCPTCGLHLVGKQEIDATDLPPEFIETDTREREYEEEYGNE